MEKLTVIIPFRNEKEEVERTLTGFFRSCPGNTTIILINDASDDGYDYSCLTKQENIRYIKNSHSLGVAQCRDLGVALASTPYLLFLDAHMRFYGDIVTPLLRFLESHPRTLACLQTKIWEGLDIPRERDGKSNTKGCRILFEPQRFWEVEWQTLRENEKQQREIEIPCVMGAAYGISKEYYCYLHGFKGLSGWGYDEQLLSTKVWLEGGRCVLLKDTEIGHVYRLNFPYPVSSDNWVRNKLVLTAYFMPERLPELLSHWKPSGKVSEVITRKEVEEERQYLESIFTRKMDFIYQLNQKS